MPTSKKNIKTHIKLIPSSQAYFWTEAAQKDMLEAKEDVKAGRVRKFKNVDEFAKGLDND